MRDWWNGRSRREQVLLGVMGALVAGFLLWFGVAAPLQAAAASARDHLAQARADEALVDAVAERVAAQGQAPSASSAAGPVDRVVADTAAVAGLQVVRVEAAEGGVQAVVSGPSTSILPWLAFLAREQGVAARHLTLVKGEGGVPDLVATFVRAAP